MKNNVAFIPTEGFSLTVMAYEKLANRPVMENWFQWLISSSLNNGMKRHFQENTIEENTAAKLYFIERNLIDSNQCLVANFSVSFKELTLSHEVEHWVKIVKNQNVPVTQ